MTEKIHPADSLYPAHHTVPSNKEDREKKRKKKRDEESGKNTKHAPDPDDEHLVDRRA